MRRILFRLVGGAFIIVLSVGAAMAQDFQKTYRLGAGDTISIRNVSGDVKIIGYDGDVVTVSGVKEGDDRELVDVEDRSTGNRVELTVRYPRQCNCDASVNFQVQVPRSVRFGFDQITSASGNLELRGLTGDVKASTASGDVLVSEVTGAINASTASGKMQVNNVRGTVSARSASGDVEVSIAKLEGTEKMEFSSASGDVDVRLPANIDADISMSSASGSVETNFPIDVKKDDYGPSMSARGTVGNGSRRLRISSASGDVSLKSL